MTIDRTVTVQVTLTHDEVVQAILRFVKDRIDADLEQCDVTVYEGEPFAFYGRVVGVLKSPVVSNDPVPV